MGSKQLGSKFLWRSQICSHTPCALNAGAERSDVPYGHASMLLLGEGSEATEPYNKYDKIRPHSIRSLKFDQKVRPLSFRPEKFDLFTATHVSCATNVGCETAILLPALTLPSSNIVQLKISRRSNFFLRYSVAFRIFLNDTIPITLVDNCAE